MRPSNVVAAANGKAPTSAKQEAARPSAPAKCEADQSSAAARASAAIVDPTLYVKAGRFVQPAANGRAMARDDARLQHTQEAGYEVHRTPLPAGHWSVWSLEHDGPRITATLVAGEAREVDARFGPKDEVDQTWGELKGLIITRCIDAVEAEVKPGLVGVAADVDIDGGVLEVLIPLPAPVQSRSRPKVMADDAIAPQRSELEVNGATPPPLVKAASAGLLDRQESGGDAAWAGFEQDGAWWPQLDSPACQHHKARRVDFRRPLFVRRSQSLDAHGARRRSRKQANARRRAAAASSERRQCMRATLPQWKAERTMMAASCA